MRLPRLLSVVIVLAATAAGPASAATLTLKFYNAGPGNDADTRLPTIPVNCNGNTDVCGAVLSYVLPEGLTVTVTATRDAVPAEVIQDLRPEWGGLGVNGGPWEDNIAGDEVLNMAFSVPVRLVRQVSFRNHFMFWDTENTILVTRDGGGPQSFVTPLGPAGMDKVTFTYAPGFLGSNFTYQLRGQESFYVSEMVVETVPEPGLLALLGAGLAGLAGAARRRARG